MSQTMNHLKEAFIIEHERESYPEDVDRIILDFQKHGYNISRSHAVLAWKRYSESLCAGWITVYDDDEIFEILRCDFKDDGGNRI